MNKFEPTATDIERALEAGEFLFYYQPITSLDTGKIVGAEALIRWRTDRGDIIPPGAFLPLAESTGLIGDITVAMLPQVVDDIGLVRSRDEAMAISFNVTAADLCSDRIVKIVRGFLESGQIEKHHLQIELTETAAADNCDQIEVHLNALADLGLDILMDDFGTGYSSVDLLSRLPFSTLKLDQGVVGRMGQSSKNLIIVKTSISLARELRMKSIAEGIETEAQYNYLLSSGCNEGQGYWMSRPLPIADFLGLLTSGETWPGSQLGMVYQAQLNNIYYRKSVLDAAFCYRRNRDEILETVINPDITHDHSESRLGRWYYGPGQALALHQEFQSVAMPHRELHETGAKLMEAVCARGDDTVIDALVREFTTFAEAVGSSLRSLEHAIIIAETHTDKSKVVE